MSSHGKHGRERRKGPQADDGKECESSEFKRNLNGCPQADGGGERKLKRINRELKEMGPQADGGGEQVSINDERLLSIDDWGLIIDYWLLIADCWWLIIDGVHTENAEDTDNSRIWQGEFIEPT